MKQSIKIILSVLILLALVIMIIPTLQDEMHWTLASLINNSGCYLKSWPRGKHNAEAKVLYDDYSWDDAVDDNSFQGYEDYLKNHKNEKYSQCVDNETYSTIVKKPMEYYIIKGNGHDITKRKVFFEPPPGVKGCSWELEADDISMTAVYLALSLIDGPLLPEKWSPDFVHTGDAGPSLESEALSYHPLNNLKVFLDTYSIFYRRKYSSGGYFMGYVIPDLVWGSNEDAYQHPYKGHSMMMFSRSMELKVCLRKKSALTSKHWSLKPISKYLVSNETEV